MHAILLGQLRVENLSADIVDLPSADYIDTQIKITLSMSFCSVNSPLRGEDPSSGRNTTFIGGL